MPKWAGSEEEREAPRFPAPVTFLYAECTCADFEYRQHLPYERGEFAFRFLRAQEVRVQSFDRDLFDNIIGQTITKGGHTHEVTMTFDSGEPTPWICKHIIAASRLWVRKEHRSRHVLIHWQGDEEVVRRLKWAKHQGDFQPTWYQLDRNVFIVAY